MSKILDWIKKHVWQTILIGFGLFVLPLIIVHVAYRIPAVSPWFASTWQAGELITYIAGFEAFIGTVALGCATVYLNASANKLSSSLLEIEEKRSCYERQPALQVNTGSAELTTLYEVFKKDSVANTMLFIEYLPLGKSFEQSKEKEVIYLSFEVINTGKVPTFINLQGLHVEKVSRKEEKTVSLFALSDNNPTSLFHPDSSIIYEFAVVRDDFFENYIYSYKFKFSLSNTINENYSYELIFTGVIDYDTVTFRLSDFSITTESKSE